MHPVSLDTLSLFGELNMRANLNFSRLETEKYWPETIFSMDELAWPADWEGRTILALSMLAQATHRTPAHLDTIIDQLPSELNEDGYIGPIPPTGVTNEQSMSGHSWMVRGLVEYINWQRERDQQQGDKALTVLKSIITNLFIPQVNNYANYPINEDTRYDDPAWQLSGNIDPNWQAGGQTMKPRHAPGESDCGCAFIALDGATAAYELLGGEELKALIEAMISAYAKLPREQLYVQTHATLSGLRGILRHYRSTGDASLLQLARDTFELYKTKAWTDHYANYNWFGIPSWTEPCAIVDSFIVSQELWEFTGEATYLQDAHHIFYNAIAHAGRENGAFGTDHCTGADMDPPEGLSKQHACGSHAKPSQFASSHMYEVFWCCNMRGGDGLARAYQYSHYTEGDIVTFPYFHSSKVALTLESGTLTLRQQANYPASGTVRFAVEDCTAGSVTLKFFAPEAWTSGAQSTVTLNGQPIETNYENGFVHITAALKAGDQIVFDSPLHFFTFDSHECMNNSKQHFSFRHGPMMLGVKTTLEDAKATAPTTAIARDAEVKPLGNAHYETTDTDGKPVHLQAMWGKENLGGPLDTFQILFAK
jgi:hypothetical protein